MLVGGGCFSVPPPPPDDTGPVTANISNKAIIVEFLVQGVGFHDGDGLLTCEVCPVPGSVIH